MISQVLTCPAFTKILDLMNNKIEVTKNVKLFLKIKKNIYLKK